MSDTSIAGSVLSMPSSFQRVMHELRAEFSSNSSEEQFDPGLLSYSFRETPPKSISSDTDLPDTDLLPLCVDLDGTLVKSDTLVDSVLLLIRHNPTALLKLPLWLLQGKACLKQHVSMCVLIDAQFLPYNKPLLEYLNRQHGAGRKVYLATAADQRLAEQVGIHCGIFRAIFASDGSNNMAGETKLAVLQSNFGAAFAYIGNARPDLPILKACREPMVANPSAALMVGLRAAGISPVQTFVDKVSPIKSWLKAVRLHQWAKNTLIFLPLLLAHGWNLGHLSSLLVGSSVAFLSFGLCASATYIVNDLLDIEADRKHHSKCRRPFAAGNLSAVSGVQVVVLFLSCSVLLALLLPKLVQGTDLLLQKPFGMAAWLAVYAVTTTAYSFFFKRVVLVDVVLLSLLYTVRIFVGSAATGIAISNWLAGFSVFFFLSLAFVKRFAELEALKLKGKHPSNGRGYMISDIEQLRSFGTSAGYASIVVLMLYITSLDSHLYHHAGRLWMLLPVLLLWMSQLWLLASRGKLNEDPVVYAITDKRSVLLGLLVLVVVVMAL